MTNKGFRGMRNSKKQPRKGVIISAVVSIALFTVFAILFYFLGVKNAENGGRVDAMANIDGDVMPVIDFTEVSTLEMRGMWIPSVANIAYPSKTGLSVKQLKGELEAIVKKAHSLGINSLFFQVRPACDALYDSDIFPASRYVSGKEGETVDGFDSLSYLLSVAKEYNIDVHAWVNPFRVTMGMDQEASLAKNSPAVLYPDYAVRYADGKTYLNPGIPKVREIVVSGVKEIVTKYPDIAGIHFDDYFYPYPSGNVDFDDEEAYLLYADGKDKADWRRENINTLIEETYNAVKEINPDCVFGVSVFGIWANKGSDTPVEGSETKGLEAYNSLYCDALSWAKGGYVDYIAPQNYWSFSTSEAPFDDIARWWNANLDGTGVDLYMGHAAYKSGDYKKGEIYKQVEMCRNLSTYKGSIFYGYENIEENIGGVADDIKRLCNEKIYRSHSSSDGRDIKINYPVNGTYLESAKSYIIGSCDPAYPLYVDGKPVSKTTGGYFGLFMPLETGKNTFTFTQNGKETKYVINNSKKVYSTASSPKTLDGMIIESPYPSKSVWLSEGERLYVSCVAPSGSKVTAKLGESAVSLTPTVYPKGKDKYLYEKYTGYITPEGLVTDTGFKVLGNVEFTATKSGETATAEGGEISAKSIDSYVYAEVKNDYTHTKVGTSTSFYDDFLPSSKGMRDYVVDIVDGYCKMRFGGYIAEENLAFTYGKPLLLNTILTTALEVNVKDSTNNKANSTDIRFGVTENIPVDVDFNGENGDMRIIIYNTDTSIIPQFKVPENPLVKSIVGKVGTRENMLMYHVTLKEKSNFYGFKIVYEDGFMIVKLNNPQTLSKGDKPLSGKRIVVDAGHGGNDIGAPGPGDRPEKVLNYDIAHSLAINLENLGAEVIESRPDDETVDLYARMDLLIEECPDLAISIHHNSVAANSNALKSRGFIALFSNNSGMSLADNVADVVCETLGRDKKPTAYQQLAVCRNHMFPSALLEMCFISNVEEYQWSVTEGNAKKSADAVTEGILEYYRNQENYLDY